MAVNFGIRKFSLDFDTLHYRAIGRSADVARDRVLNFETGDEIEPSLSTLNIGIGTGFALIDGDGDADLVIDVTLLDGSTPPNLNFDDPILPVVNTDVASRASGIGKMGPLASDMVKAGLIADMAKIGLLADYSDILPDVLWTDQRVDPILLRTHDLGI